MSAKLGAIVLAAGESTRMGRNKLLLTLDGESLLRRCVRRVLAAGLDSVTVVLGFQAELVAREIEDLDCRRVINEHHARGQHGSVQRGLEAISGDSDAAMILLADMPQVTPQMIRTIAELYRRTRPPLVVSRYGETFAPPTVYDRELFRELRELDAASPTRRVLLRHEARAAVAEWPAAALLDLDDPADLDRLDAD